MQPSTLYLVRSALNAQRLVGDAVRAVRADMVQTQVYIGLNDAETRAQKYDTERYVELSRQVCIEHKMPFSFDVISGGYIHDDGEYTEENTIMLTFIDADQEAVDEIARDLFRLFNQESVLVTTDRIRARMVREVPRAQGE